jgi:DNA-binding MarR family transcriptional regulator
VYEKTPESFLLDLLQKRVDIQDIDFDLIDNTLMKVKEKTSNYSGCKRFLDYLNNMRLYYSLIHKMRSEGVESFKRFLETGSIKDLDFRNLNALKKGVLANFLSKLKMSSLEIDSSCSLEKNSYAECLPLKMEYFTGIKATLNPLYSQTLANRQIVMHSVLLEGCTTQERIEKCTLLPRSTISEVLGQLVKRGLIKVTRMNGKRIKLYQPTISFAELMFSSFDRIIKYESSVITRLAEFISVTSKLLPVSKEMKIFLDFLRKLKKAYSFAKKYSKKMKVELVIKLKDEYAKGFLFI